MQKIIIIGNLVHSPDFRTTPSGLSVCSFDVAVNRREKSDGKKEAVMNEEQPDVVMTITENEQEVVD